MSCFHVYVGFCTHVEVSLYANAVRCIKREAGLKEEFDITEHERRKKRRLMTSLDTGLFLLLPQTTAFGLI